MNKKKEPCVYVTAIKQYSWDAKNRSGSFNENKENPDKKIQIKLDAQEIAGIIYAVENNTSFSAFHSFEETNTSISFKPYVKKKGGNAFSLTLKRNSAEQFGIGVELSEAQLLIEFFKYVLTHFFQHKEDEYQAKRAAATIKQGVNA